MTTDRTADSTTALLAALRAGGYAVSTVVTGAVIVDGQHIDAGSWDSMAMSWDGTADGLDELGWGRAADAMRDDEALAAGHVACECGEWSGERCEWSGPESETVVVEWMPEYLRASHRQAGNSGVYPHNGARLIRCERSCARRIVSDAPEWARIVES